MAKLIYLKMPYTYDYPRPAFGTDLLLISKEDDKIEILLIERLKDPFAGFWAFPGGFVEEGESCEQAALRELEEETGLQLFSINQIGTFSKPNRDPRGWVVTVAFYAWVEKSKLEPKAGDDAKNVQWFSIHSLPALAFDHQEILNKAVFDLKLNNSTNMQ
jgi:8-oxo-dGTP diphosphatase